MRPTVALGGLLSLVACPGDKLSDQIMDGEVSLCAQEVGAAAADTGYTLELEGEVLGDGPGEELDTAEPCRGSARVLRVAGDDGATWNLGYTLRDNEHALIAASAGLDEGDRVSVELLATIGYFYTGYGLVVREGDQLVAAIADNKAPPLGDELSVERGRKIASLTNDCGLQEGYELDFTGDEALTLAPVQSGALSVGGVALTAYALAEWGWEDNGFCTDLIGATEWAVLRGG